MSRKFFVKFLVITITLSFCYSMKFLNKDHQQNTSVLLDFTCATAKDELEKHPEMRTIAMVELENNFPSDFSAKILKCLPPDVAKILINPHSHVWKKNLLKLPKETLVIYIAEKVDWDETFFSWRFPFDKNLPVISHLSKHLIVSNDETKLNESERIFNKLLNVVQIYEENQKVIAKSFDRTKNLMASETFENTQRANLSQILFPDRVKNLNGQKLIAVWDLNPDAYPHEGSDRPNNKWIPYLDIIVEKLNATLKFIEMFSNKTNWEAYQESKRKSKEDLIKLIIDDKMDFYINLDIKKLDLESYNNVDWCFLVPLPEPFSITELILFLPMDKSCWMWLGITIAVSTLVWRISEGHWNFAFGAFSHFMGQAQLSVRIRTNRLAMKILLQLLIFAIFIFSNGYQSIVTSFMLNPMQQKLLKTVDEVLDSGLKIRQDLRFELLYRDNPKYQKAEEDGRIYHIDLDEKWIKKLKDVHLAFLQPCKKNQMRAEFQGDGKTWRGIYLINEVVYTQPKDLYIRPFHPYIENFQELMDRSFEAGLHQAWERFFWKIWGEGEKRTESAKGKEYLDFELIAPSLYILAFGLPSAFLILLFEIFWKDFVMELTKKYFLRKWREIFRREIELSEETE